MNFTDLPHGCYFRAKLPTENAPDLLFTFVKRGSYHDEATLVGENGLAGGDFEDWPDNYPEYPANGEFEFPTGWPCERLDESEWPDVSQAMMDKCRADFGWDKAQALVKSYTPIVGPDEDEPVYRFFIGTVSAIMPSGKVYAFWTTNQTDEDMNLDNEYYDALKHLAEEQGLFVDFVDNDIFLCQHTSYEEVAKEEGFTVSEADSGFFIWWKEKEPTHCSTDFSYESEDEAWEDCCKANKLVQN